MYDSAPTASEAAALGLTVEEASDHMRCEVWPDNLTTVNAFVAMATQWRVGPMGAYGLDYVALPPVLEMQGIERAEWRELLEGIRQMEDEALAVMRRSAKK